MQNSDAEFNESERAELARIEAEAMAELEQVKDQGLLSAETPPGDAPAQADAAPAPVEAAAPQAVAPAAAPAQAEPKGDPRAALRASRHAERRAREEADRLRAENEALKARVPQQPDATDDVMSVVEADHPEVAALVKGLKSQVEELTAKVAPAQAPAEPEFIPESLPPEAQELVDEIPELAEWQASKDKQDHWQAAKAADRLLLTLPKWKDATAAERFTEAVRRVKADMAQPTPIDPKEVARKRIDATPERGIETLSDLRGGQEPTGVTPDWSRMNDDEIIASL
jgi:hypothetical protein